MYVADPRDAFFFRHRFTVVITHLVEPSIVNLPTLFLTVLFNHVVQNLLKIWASRQIHTLRTKCGTRKEKEVRN